MKPRNETVKTLAVGVALLIAATVTQASGPIFVQIDGIRGDSQDGNHKNWIEAEAFSQAVTNSGSMHVGGGGGAGKASFSSITLIKRLDVASPQIWFAAAQGKILREATIEYYSDPNSREPFAKIRLEDVLVVAVRHDKDPEANHEAFLEEVQLDFARIEMTITPIRPDGSQGAPIEAGWDVQANTDW